MKRAWSKSSYRFLLHRSRKEEKGKKQSLLRSYHLSYDVIDFFPSYPWGLQMLKKKRFLFMNYKGPQYSSSVNSSSFFCVSPFSLSWLEVGFGRNLWSAGQSMKYGRVFVCQMKRKIAHIVGTKEKERRAGLKRDGRRASGITRNNAIMQIWPIDSPCRQQAPSLPMFFFFSPLFYRFVFSNACSWYDVITCWSQCCHMVRSTSASLSMHYACGTWCSTRNHRINSLLLKEANGGLPIF